MNNEEFDKQHNEIRLELNKAYLEHQKLQNELVKVEVALKKQELKMHGGES